jgi:catechol 2,3-dioxygenase-like lactoylglutathione lyase family enzyme
VGVTGLDHILLLCEDVDVTAEFYRRTLGLAVGPRPEFDFAGRWLYAGGVPCVHLGDRREFERSERRRARDASGAKIDHVAFTATDHDGMLAALERDGIVAERHVMPGSGVRQLYVTDPDGTRVEINFPGDASELR